MQMIIKKPINKRISQDHRKNKIGWLTGTRETTRGRKTGTKEKIC